MNNISKWLRSKNYWLVASLIHKFIIIGLIGRSLSVESHKVGSHSRVWAGNFLISQLMLQLNASFSKVLIILTWSLFAHRRLSWINLLRISIKCGSSQNILKNFKLNTTSIIQLILLQLDTLNGLGDIFHRRFNLFFTFSELSCLALYFSLSEQSKRLL